MNNKKDFYAIVIGSNHINSLGVIRSLGENNVDVYYIMTSSESSFSKKSKYITKYWSIFEDEESILKILDEKFEHLSGRGYLIPTTDFAALILDKNYDLLSKKFIVPNVNKKSGMIVELMDKKKQFDLSKQFDIKMADSKEIDLSKKINDSDIIIPCILKPIVSAGCEKSDITICHSINELNAGLDELRNKKYSSILLQEYIDYDYECDLSGVSNGTDVIIPNIVKKINIYPAKKGSTSCGLVTSCNIINIDSLIKFIKKIKYNGIFDIEIFIKGDTYYLNEINFRNSAISYGLTKNNVFIPYFWIALNENLDINFPKKYRDYLFVVEDFEIKAFLKGEITFWTFLSHFFKSKRKIYFSLKDLNPFIYKLIYMIKKGK